MSHKICLLPEQLRRQIRSSEEITNPSQVIAGLIENSIDAKAKSIHIRADLAKGYISVQDDGSGINSTEFQEDGLLGILYCTSKSNITASSASSSYGRHGRFLASLSTLSLLSITSRQPLDAAQSRVILHRGKVIHRQQNIEFDGFQDCGTTVVVNNLFADLPVRAKYTYEKFTSPARIEKGFEVLKQLIIRYLLATHGEIYLSLSLQGGPHRLVYRPSISENAESAFTLPNTVSILTQTKILHNPRNEPWKFASMTTSAFTIRAKISLDPSPTKNVQFFSFGQVPIYPAEHSRWLYSVINDIFQISNFGCVSEQTSTEIKLCDDRKSRKRPYPSARYTKAVDRWPMFNIHVDLKAEIAQGTADIHDLLGRSTSSAMQSLALALETLITQFLLSHGHVVKGQSTDQQVTSGTLRTSLARPNVSNPKKAITTCQVRSHLQDWHRTKSGRHLDQERGNYGLPFAKGDNPDVISHVVSETKALSNELSSGEPILKKPGSESSNTQEVGPQVQDNAADAGVAVGSTHVILWKDPRTGQTTEIDSRTGVTLDSGPSSSAADSVDTPSSGSLMRQRELSKGISRSPHQLSALLRRYGGTQSRACERSIPKASIGDLGRHGYGPVDGFVDLSQLTKHISVANLQSSCVVGQVDQKFVVAVVPKLDALGTRLMDLSLIILIDQHAADERIKLESLCHEFFETDPLLLCQALVFEIDEPEASLLESMRDYFAAWHVVYGVEVPGNQTNSQRGLKTGQRQKHSVKVSSLPPLIAERCRAEPRMLIELLRQEIWKEGPRGYNEKDVDKMARMARGSWLSFAYYCPRGIVEMLKSRSCRTAVMFNDRLDQKQAEKLVEDLSRCELPFQCAHGRPTMTIVADLDKGANNSSSINFEAGKETSGSERDGFGVAWRTWIKQDDASR